MQEKQFRTFNELTADDYLLLQKLLIVVAESIERDLKVRITKFMLEDSGGTLAVGIERLRKEGDPDE